jgi:hypothetical protein
MIKSFKINDKYYSLRQLDKMKFEVVKQDNEKKMLTLKVTETSEEFPCTFQAAAELFRT